MVPTDAELVAKARNNKMYTFQQLIERHKRKIYYTALGVLGNHHDSEDILQEALLQALRSLDRLRNPDGFGPWIVRIAYNRSIDLLRKRKRELIPADDDEGKSFFDRMQNMSPTGNPDKMLEAGEISKVIKYILNTLPQSQRNAFTLKHIAQLSIKEIAETTERY